MRCQDVREELVGVIDGETSGRRREEVDRHLDACAECRAERATMERLLRAIGDLPASAPVSPALEEGVVARIRVRRGGSSWRRLVGPGVAAAAMLALAIGLWPVAESDRLVDSRGAEVDAGAASAPRPRMRSSGGDAETLPPELASEPDFFVNLPILRNMEKLQNFEAIRRVRPSAGSEESANG